MKRTALLALLILAACAKEPEQAAAPGSSDAPTVAASTAAPPSLAADPPQDSRQSSYTSFKDCTLVKEGEGEDWSVSHCKGRGGYDLRIDYGDARDDLVLLRRGKAPVELGLVALGTGGFNTLGDMAEWRGPAGAAPDRLIVRNRVSEDPEDSAKQTDILMVIDLNQACVVAQIRPRANQNDAARALADGPPRVCLK